MSARAIRRAWLTDVIRQIPVAARQTYAVQGIKAGFADAYGHIANKRTDQRDHAP